VLHAGHRQQSGAWLDFGLASVADRELGRQLSKDQQLSDWSKTLLTPEQLVYAAADAAVLMPLAADLKAKLAEADLAEVAALEMRAMPGIAWAAPVAVARDGWTALAAAAEAARGRLAEAMERLVPNPGTLTATWNWNAPEEVKAAFQAVGVTLSDTDDGTLADLDHPLAGLLRDWRSAAKLAGSYGRGFLADHAPDGFVLPSWRQIGAESGRMSCSDPNLQQVPRTREYRRCFVARPGHVLVKADYSQIELRIAARIAPEPEMVKAYRAGEDLHARTAARLLGKKSAEVTKDDRQLAKAVNFGLLFGMGWKGLQGYAAANFGVRLSDAEARSYRETFFRVYPGLKRWHQRVGGQLDRLFRQDPDGTHEVRTLAGRRRVLPVARGAGENRYPGKPDALNAPVQGTGADGLKAAIGLLWERRAECPGAVPVIFAHDEIVLEAPEEHADRAGEWLRRAMIDGMAPLIDPVPVEVAVNVGRTWGGD
jgi:DNA polymerase-1